MNQISVSTSILDPNKHFLSYTYPPGSPLMTEFQYQVAIHAHVAKLGHINLDIV